MQCLGHTQPFHTSLTSCSWHCSACQRRCAAAKQFLQQHTLRRSFSNPHQSTFLHQALHADSGSSTTGSASDLLNWSLDEGAEQPGAVDVQPQPPLELQPSTPSSGKGPAVQRAAKHPGQQRQRQRPVKQPHLDAADQRQHAGSSNGSHSRPGRAAEGKGEPRSHHQQAQQQQKLQPPQQKQEREPSHAAAAAAAAAGTGRGESSKGLSNREFLEAQQRVLQLLVSADITNPAAAAKQLPDSIDETVIALQLLATAPRPKQHVALRQYQAAAAVFAAAVLDKFKGLLLQQQQQPLRGTAAAAGAGSSDACGSSADLAAALGGLPATKVAAAIFSLGVLRQYDTALTPALEEATRQLLARSAFNANQLGQVGQGFSYLDHPLNPGWQQDYVMAFERHLPSLKAAQLASLSEFLIKYCLRQYNMCSYRLGSSRVDPAAAGTAAAAGGTGGAAGVLVAGFSSSSSSSCGIALPAAWVSGFLAAAGSQAHSLKPMQLAQVLAAAAAIYEQQQQQQADVSAASSSQQMPAALAVLPLPMEPTAAAADSPVGAAAASGDNSSSGHSRMSSSSSSQWLLSLLAAFHRQLPDLTLPYLAAALPSLALLTSSPWPQQQLQPVLLQVRLLLSAAGGPEVVAAAAGAAQLAGSGQAVAAADPGWCDALLQRLHALLPGLCSRDLAAVVRTLALLAERPYRAWVYELCGRLRVEAKGFTAEEIVDVIEGLAGLRIVLDHEVLHLLVLGIRRWMSVLGSRDLQRLAAALRAMYPRKLPGRTVQQLVEELERRCKFLQLQEQQQQQQRQQGLRQQHGVGFE